MADKSTEPDLSTWLDLRTLMRCCPGTHEERRTFGLENGGLTEKPFALLAAWVRHRRHLLPDAHETARAVSVLRSSARLSEGAAFFLGLFAGTGLLAYSGGEPVNVLYFLFFAFVLPLLSMLLSLAAMARADRTDAFAVHLSPAYWLPKLFSPLLGRAEETVPFSPLLANWLVIRRSQILALLFSVGLLLALLAMVTGKDLAFSWSSTLDVSSQTLHAIFAAIALPWRAWLPQAVPSPELIELSRHFRLGGGLEPEMVRNAARLGEWWKFLAMTTLVYAVGLRALFAAAASRGYRRALRRALLGIDGVRELLRQMREPYVSTRSPREEAGFDGFAEAEAPPEGTAAGTWPFAVGWALTEGEVALQNERRGVAAVTVLEAGGMHSLDEDAAVAGRIDGDVLLYVKAWEPPTMDFVDFLTALHDRNAGTVLLCPLGMPQQDSRPSEEDFRVWAEKTGALKLPRVRMCR